MIDLEFLQSLIRTLDESSLDHIEIERGGTRVRLSKSAPATGTAGTVAAGPPIVAAAPAAPPATPPTAPSESEEAQASTSSSSLVDITSPMVGTFYRAPAPDAPPYVDVGASVGLGETLCIIEAMKLMNELEAEVAGRIAEICVENAEPVEYGQVLFRVDPA